MNNDPLHDFGHAWVWPYIVAAIALSLVVFTVVYWSLPER